MFNDIIKQHSNNDVYPVFVILTQGRSLLSTLIKKVTKQAYSHSILSFDTSLRAMYSFGRTKRTMANPILGGLSKEDFKDFNWFHPDTFYAVYVTFVSKDEHDKMLSKVVELTEKNHDKEIKYNLLGMLTIAFNKPYESDDGFFCSQFIDVILKAGDKGHKKSAALVTPGDFANLKHFKFVMKGTVKNYDEEKLREKLRELGNKIGKNIIM